MSASCATCPYFNGPKAAPEGLDVSRDIGGVYAKGDCIRFPKTERKAPTDLCAEHPEIFEKDATITTLDAIAVETRRVAVAMEKLLEALSDPKRKKN